MPLYLANHKLAYRPLRGGIEIYNTTADESATLGFVAKSAGAAVGDTERWIVTALHALTGVKRQTVEDGEPLYQPFPKGDGVQPVAHAVVDRVDAGLDCAACRISDGVEAVGDILGLGPPGALKPPFVGMHVVKSGLATGVTEGVISAIGGDRLTIIPPRGFPQDYSLTDSGDSGALWVERGTGRAVALHTGGNAGGAEEATATPIELVLRSLRLELITAADED